MFWELFTGEEDDLSKNATLLVSVELPPSSGNSKYLYTPKYTYARLTSSVHQSTLSMFSMRPGFIDRVVCVANVFWCFQLSSKNVFDKIWIKWYPENRTLLQILTERTLKIYSILFTGFINNCLTRNLRTVHRKDESKLTLEHRNDVRIKWKRLQTKQVAN